MDQNDAIEQPSEQTMNAVAPPPNASTRHGRSETIIAPQTGSESCSTCGNPLESRMESEMTYPFVYAIANIEPRFPTLGIQKEYSQVTGRTDTVGLTDRQALYKALQDPDNRYLARQMCYVLMIGGI